MIDEGTTLSWAADLHDGPVIEGFDPQVVDDFVQAVTEETERLRVQIREVRAREARARTLLGVHETMVSRMLGAYRDVQARRQAAESAATEILNTAHRDAAAILEAAGAH